MEIKKPEVGNFKLTKVKLVKDGGLDVQYQVTETIDSVVDIVKYNVESPKEIHPDLACLFDKFKPYIAKALNLTSFLTLFELKETKVPQDLFNKGLEYANRVADTIDIKGLSITGDGGNKGVVITVMYEFSNGQKACINTPKIKFETDSFGFEEDIEEITLNLEVEVYKFLFENKKAQLELFDGADDAVEL